MVTLTALAISLLTQVNSGGSTLERDQQKTTVGQPLADLLEANGLFVPKTIHPINAEDIWQTAPYCGANCLYILLKLNDKEVSYTDLRRDIPTTAKGASLLDLQRSAERNGLTTEVISISPADIARLKLPVIALLGARLDQAVNGHYVVVCGESDADVVAVDGTTGNLDRISRSEFNRAFSGYVLTKEGGMAPVTGGYGNVDIALIAGCLIDLLAIGACKQVDGSGGRVEFHRGNPNGASSFSTS